MQARSAASAQGAVAHPLQVTSVKRTLDCPKHDKRDCGGTGPSPAPLGGGCTQVEQEQGDDDDDDERCMKIRGMVSSGVRDDQAVWRLLSIMPLYIDCCVCTLIAAYVHFRGACACNRSCKCYTGNGELYSSSLRCAAVPEERPHEPARPSFHIRKIDFSNSLFPYTTLTSVTRCIEFRLSLGKSESRLLTKPGFTYLFFTVACMPRAGVSEERSREPANAASLRQACGACTGHGLCLRATRASPPAAGSELVRPVHVPQPHVRMYE